MKPKSYIKQKNGYKFIYDLSDLKKWINLGNKDGNVGSILLSYKNGLKTYSSYGTIENPSRCRLTVKIKHLDVFSGVFDVNSIINPKPIIESTGCGILIPTNENKYKNWKI